MLTTTGPVGFTFAPTVTSAVDARALLSPVTFKVIEVPPSTATAFDVALLAVTEIVPAGLA